MNIVKILLTCLLCVNTFNVAPVFAEEPDQPEETVVVDEVLQEEADAVETTVIEEEVAPEITVLDEEAVPVETNEIEEIQVEEVSEEVILTEEDIPEENIEEESSSEEIIEITPEPTVEPTPEVILETTPEIVNEAMVEPTLAPTLEPTPEPTATPEAEEELEELEEISEEDVVEEEVVEETLVDAGGAVQIKPTDTYIDDFYYDINAITNTKDIENDRFVTTKTRTQTHWLRFEISEEDLRSPGKFMRFGIKNDTNNDVEFYFDSLNPDENAYFMFKDNKNVLSEFKPGDSEINECKIPSNANVGIHYIRIVTHGAGKIYFTLSMASDDYPDIVSEASEIEYNKTYHGKINSGKDTDRFLFIATGSKVTVNLTDLSESKESALQFSIAEVINDNGSLSTSPVYSEIYVPYTLYDGTTVMAKRITATFASGIETLNVKKGLTYSISVRNGDNKSDYSIKIIDSSVIADNLPKVQATAVYNSAHGADIRWKPIEGIRYYGIWRKRTNPITKKVEEKMIQVIDTNSYTTKENGDYKWIDPYLKDKYTDSGNEWQGGWVYYITARSTGNTSKAYNDGKHLDIDGPISNKLNLYRLRNPEIKSVKANGNGKATITWTNVTNAFGYEVQYTLDNGKTWKKVPEVIAARWGSNGREIKEPNYKASVTVSGLPKGQTVNFRIRCRKTNANLGTTWSQYSLWTSTTVK